MSSKMARSKGCLPSCLTICVWLLSPTWWEEGTDSQKSSPDPHMQAVALKRLRQENHSKFEVKLGYTIELWFKKKIKMEFPAVGTLPLAGGKLWSRLSFIVTLSTMSRHVIQLWCWGWALGYLKSSGGPYSRPLALEEEGETRGDTNTWLCLLLCEALYWLGACQQEGHHQIWTLSLSCEPKQTSFLIKLPSLRYFPGVLQR